MSGVIAKYNGITYIFGPDCDLQTMNRLLNLGKAFSQAPAVCTLCGAPTALVFRKAKYDNTVCECTNCKAEIKFREANGSIYIKKGDLMEIPEWKGNTQWNQQSKPQMQQYQWEQMNKQPQRQSYQQGSQNQQPPKYAKPQTQPVQRKSEELYDDDIPF